MNGQSPWGLQEFQMQDALMKRQREQQLAEALQAQQLQTVSNPLQGLAMVLKEHLWSRPRGEQKDAALSDQLAQFFAEDERRRQMEAQQQESMRQQQRQEALQDYERKQGIKAEHRAPSLEEQLFQQLPENMRGQAALGKFGLLPDKQAPSALQERIALARQMGASPEQLQAIVMGEAGKGPSAPSGYRQTEDGNLEPIPGGPADPATASKTAIGQEARRQLALLDNAITNATEYKKRVVGEGGSFNDMASRLDDTPELLRSAVQDYLYVKTGAAAPDSEVEKAFSFYAPATTLGIPTERDTTAAAKVDRLLADLQRHRQTLLGEQQGQKPALQSGNLSALLDKYAPQ